PDAAAETARDEREERERRRKGGGREGARREDEPHAGRAAASSARGDPARERQRQCRDRGHREDDDPETSAVECELVLQRRQARVPDSVDRPEDEKPDDERSMGSGLDEN